MNNILTTISFRGHDSMSYIIHIQVPDAEYDIQIRQYYLYLQTVNLNTCHLICELKTHYCYFGITILPQHLNCNNSNPIYMLLPR